MHHSANATRLRHRCTVLLLTASLGLGGLASTGCQTLSTAQSGMQTGVSTAQTTKSTADQTKQLGTDLKGEVDKATGKKRRKTLVLVNRFDFCGDNRRAAPEEPEGRRAPPSQPAAPPAPSGGAPLDDDDIPF